MKNSNDELRTITFMGENPSVGQHIKVPALFVHQGRMIG
jgi:hypothetical protein